MTNPNACVFPNGSGLTKRELFALEILKQLMLTDDSPVEVIFRAVHRADLLVAELNK